MPDELIGKTVIDVDLRARFGANIIAIENGNEIQEYVRPDYCFKKGDILFVSGSKEGLCRLLESAQ